MLKKISIGVLIAVVLISATSYGVYKIFYPGERTTQKKPVLEEEKFVAVGRTNIAVLGVDQRSEDDGRADTIFVISYEPKTKRVSMLSVPRDTRVRITETRWDKINHSFNYGGAKAVVKALENFLGIHIDYYVQLDFHGFEKMVDAIDGVELNVEDRMYYEDPWDGDHGFIIDLQPGLQKLDGKKAIQYVRYRDEEGDIGRVQRQQHFINTVYEKMLSPDMFKKFPELAAVAYDSVDTNMSVVDILSVGRTMHENARTGIRSFSVPGMPVFIDQINYWIPDVVAVRSEVAQVLGLDDREKDRFMSSATRVAYAYESSLPADTNYSDSDEEDSEKDKDTEDKDKDGKEDKDKKDDNKKPGDDKTTKPGKDDKDKQEKPEDKGQQEKKPDNQDKTPRQLRASVINCSGTQDGGKKMERLLESNGVSVVSIFDGSEQTSSSIVSNTQDGWVVSRLAALPFRYSLRINKSDTSKVEAVIYVGKDFIQN